MKKCFSNIPYFQTINDGLDIPTEMTVMSKLRDWKSDASTAYISTKHRKSNAAAVSEWIRIFMKDKSKHYVCIVTQSKLFKPDTVELYYKDVV